MLHSESNTVYRTLTFQCVILLPPSLFPSTSQRALCLLVPCSSHERPPVEAISTVHEQPFIVSLNMGPACIIDEPYLVPLGIVYVRV